MVHNRVVSLIARVRIRYLSEMQDGHAKARFLLEGIRKSSAECRLALPHLSARLVGVGIEYRVFFVRRN